MKVIFIPQRTRKLLPGIRWMPGLVLIFMAFAWPVGSACAQTNNLSDWNVPPPMPPGTTTKGATTGKGGSGKPVVLTITDVPAVLQPGAGPVQLPLLAAISATPPAIGAPEQPVVDGGNVAFSQIPLPVAPDAGDMPQRTLQDAPVPQTADIPLPAAPGMPPLPAAPAALSQNQTLTNVAIPLVPNVASLPSPIFPVPATMDAWAIPGIPEGASVRLVANTRERSVKPGAKRRRKS